jgi:hypothetical protein
MTESGSDGVDDLAGVDALDVPRRRVVMTLRHARPCRGMIAVFHPRIR